MVRGTVVSLLLAVLFVVPSKQKCSEYLKCRSDENERRWRCNEEHQRLVAETCRVGQHIRSIKRLTVRREADLAVCIAIAEADSEGGESQNSCSSVQDSTEAENTLCEQPVVRPSRCAQLRRCCPLASKCENRVQYAALTSVLNMQRSAAEVLLRACRSDMLTVIAANGTGTEHHKKMTIAISATAVLRLIAEQNKTSVKPRKEMKFAQGTATATTRLQRRTTERHSSNIPAPLLRADNTAPLVPISEDTILLSRIAAFEHAPNRSHRSQSHITAQPKGKINAATRPRMYGAKRIQLSPSTRSSENDTLHTVDRETAKQMGSVLLQDGAVSALGRQRARLRGSLFPGVNHQQTVGKNLLGQRRRPSYNVDVIIEHDRGRPVKVFTDKSFKGTTRPFSLPHNRKFKTDTRETEPGDPMIASVPPPRQFLNHIPPPPPPPPPLRSTIRRPWSNQFRQVRMGKKIWKGNSHHKRDGVFWDQEPHKKQGMMRPWTMEPIRSQTLRPFAQSAANNTDDIRDNTISTRYRLKKRLREEEEKRGRASPTSRQKFTKIPYGGHLVPISSRSQSESQEDSIYEDILSQEKHALASRSNTPSYEVYDDSWRDRTGFRTLPLPPRYSTSIDSFNPNQKRKGLGNLLRATRTTTIPTTMSRTTLVAPTTTTTDNPLVGPIVESPLTNNETPHAKIKQDELDQIVDSRFETLVEFENVALPPPVFSNPELEHSIDEKVTSQPGPKSEVGANIDDSEFGPSFSTIPLPTLDASSATTRTEWTTTTRTLPPALVTEPKSAWQGSHGEQMAMTIIPTMTPVEWTPPPFDAIVDINSATKSTIRDRILVLDSSDSAEASGENDVLEDVDPPPVEAKLFKNAIDRKRAMGIKLLQSKPVRLPADDVLTEVENQDEAIPFKNDSIIPITDAKGSETESVELLTDDAQSSGEPTKDAFSVLKLPEATVRLSHCEVYSICLDEMVRQEAECEDDDRKAGRVFPKQFRKRRNFCNRRLLPDYEVVDNETKQLEENYSSCIKGRLGQKITEVEPTKCTAHSLPSTLSFEPCHSKLHVIKHHCSKLARCCPDAEFCRNEVDRSEAASQLRRKKEALALASARCHVQSHKDYRKRMKRKWRKRRLL